MSRIELREFIVANSVGDGQGSIDKIMDAIDEYRTSEIKDFLGEVYEASAMKDVTVEIERNAMGVPGVRFYFQNASPLFKVETLVGLGAPMIVKKIDEARAELIAHIKRTAKENKNFTL